MSASILHHSLRSEVVIELGPDAAPHLRWGRCLLPTLLDVEPLRDAAITAGLDDGALFANFSSRNPLELSDAWQLDRPGCPPWTYRQRVF